MTAPKPAADVRQMIEDIRARHGEYYFSRIEPMGNYCNSCGHEWPCDAYLAADRLEQAVTALEWYADRENYRCFDGWTGSPVDNDEGNHARNALRRMAGGE